MPPELAPPFEHSEACLDRQDLTDILLVVGPSVPEQHLAENVLQYASLLILDVAQEGSTESKYPVLSEYEPRSL